MVSWFVPVVLFVIAAFALGVIVGRLAWASSGSGAPARPSVATVTNRVKRSMSTALPEPSPDSGAHALPMWQMREIDPPVTLRPGPTGDGVR